MLKHNDTCLALLHFCLEVEGVQPAFFLEGGQTTHIIQPAGNVGHSDRVDGVYRLYTSPGSTKWGAHGCSSLSERWCLSGYTLPGRIIGGGKWTWNHSWCPLTPPRCQGHSMQRERWGVTLGARQELLTKIGVESTLRPHGKGWGNGFLYFFALANLCKSFLAAN